jgi:hypothetical protein
MDKMLKVAGITLSGTLFLIMLDLLLGDSDFMFMVSLYFLLALAIVDSLAIKPQTVQIEKEDKSYRDDEILTNVRKAANGENDARNFIINTLNSLNAVMTDEEKNLLSAQGRFFFLKRQKGIYLKILKSILDRIDDERHY